MIIFANGGDKEKGLSNAVNVLKEFIIPKMKILYIPFAANNSEYDENYYQMVKKISDLSYSIMDTINEPDDLNKRDFNEYSLIIIDDGNPFKLINELKNSVAFELINKAAHRNTPILGIGAGAIVLGNNLEQSEINHDYNNLDNNIKGFNFFDNKEIYIYTHKYNTSEYKQESQKLKYAAKHREIEIIAMQKQSNFYRIDSGYYKLDSDYYDYINKDGIKQYPYCDKIQFSYE